MRMTVSSESWGAGINFESNYGIIDASDALTLDFWMKSETDAMYTIRFRENGSAASYQDENWISPDQSILAADGWKHFSVPISGFNEDGNGNGACQPNCNAGFGNDTLELNAIRLIELHFNATLVGAVIRVDDIEFIVPDGTPTVGPTFTPTPTGTVSPTPCVPSATFGNTNLGSNPVNVNGNYPDLSHYVLASPGDAVSMSIYIGNVVDGTVQVLLYADSGGLPGALLSYSGDSGPLTADSWNTIPINQTYLAAGTYWLGFQRSAGSTTWVHKDVVTDGAYSTFTPQTYLSPPNPYPLTGSLDDSAWSIFVNYCP
jgi:hypothetical protein